MPDKDNRWLRTLFLSVLVLAGVALTILPHWLRTGRRSIQPIILEAPGRFYPHADTPDSIDIIFRLTSVTDPDLNLSIIDVGLIETLVIDTSAQVRVILGLTTPYCPYAKELARAVLDTIVNTPGVKNALVKIDPNLIRPLR